MQSGLSVHMILTTRTSSLKEYAFSGEFCLLARALYSFLFLYNVPRAENAWTEGPDCIRIPQIHGPKAQTARLGPYSFRKNASAMAFGPTCVPTVAPTEVIGRSSSATLSSQMARLSSRYLRSSLSERPE